MDKTKYMMQVRWCILYAFIGNVLVSTENRACCILAIPILLYGLFFGIRWLVVFCLFAFTKRGQTFMAQTGVLGHIKRVQRNTRNYEKALEKEYGTIEYQEEHYK